MSLLGEIPLLGRHDELDVLETLYGRINEPRMLVIVIRGEAGIGKSHLLRAFLDRLRGRGATVLLGRGDAAERTIAYGTLEHALATLPRQTPDTDELVDGLRNVITAPTDSGLHLPDERVARMLGATTRLFRHLTDEGPVIVAVDDLHAADDDTLALLAAVARRFGSTPVVMVTTVRTDLPAAAGAAADRFLGHVADEAVVETIDLGPLAEIDVEELIQRLTGYRPAPSTITAALERSGGNPFITGELIQALREADALVLDDDGRLELRDGDIRLGPRAGLVRRLVPFGEEGLRLARVLAVTTGFHVSELTAAGRVARLSEETAEAAFDGLVKSRLLVVQPDGTYGFRHRILKETLYADLGPAERRRLHADLAAELLQLRNEGHTVQYGRIAQHALDAADDIDEIAADLSQAAGDEIAAVAPRSAAMWYERAIEVTAPGSAKRPVRLARLAHALLRSNMLPEAVERGHEALAHLSDGGDRVRCAADTAEALLRCGAGRRALDLLDVELARGDSETRLLVLRVTALAYLQRYDEAMFAAERATDAAVPGSTDHLLALSASAALADQLGDMRRVKDLIDEQLAMAPNLPRHSQQFLYGFAALLLASEWRIRDAEPLLAKAEALAGDDAEMAVDDRIETAAMLVDYHGGRWDLALDRAVRRSSALTETGPSVYLAQAQIVEARILASRGDVAAARRRAGRSYPDLVPCWVAAQHYTRAWIELLDYQLDEARRILEDALPIAPRGSPADLLVNALMATTMHRLGDRRAALSFLDACTPGTDSATVPYVSVNAWLARAEVTGDVEAARACYAAAAAESLSFEMAVAKLMRGLLGDDSQTNLTEAWRTFRELGATLWRERAVTALRERNLPIPRSRRRDPQALSDTELQIVRLIADGLRNREIAERLAYSPHTVETYISRIYAKTGVSSRTGLLRVLDEGAR